jgi:transcriptional antiterminator RfaH
MGDRVLENWYAIHTKPRQELKAEEHLQHQAFETYLPRIKELRRYRNKWRNVVAPMFPRYLFISLELGRDNIYAIRSTRGVSGLVRFGKYPKPVPHGVINFLKYTADQETGIHIPDRPLLEKGDGVTVLDGPFGGLQGIFQAVKGEERVIILLDILGKSNTVTLKRDLVLPTG